MSQRTSLPPPWTNPLAFLHELWIAMTTLPTKPMPEEAPFACKKYLDYQWDKTGFAMVWITLYFAFWLTLFMGFAAWRMGRSRDMIWRHMAEMEPEEREREFERICEIRGIRRRAAGREKWVDSKV